jgi:uncharacterized iron-regulated membrane protein
MSSSISAPAQGAASSRLYRALWRWHFFAGLFVVPFLLMLTLTGLVMMVYANQSNEKGWVPDVAVGSAALPVSAQAEAALSAVPGGQLQTYIAPQAADRPAFFDISAQGKSWMVAVDPYSAKVLERIDPASTVRAIAEDIHGTLLIGDVGDRLIETAASLTVILIATGIYLWWPRQGGLLPALLPDMSLRGRGFWRELHKAIGVWTALILLLFTLSGLAWAGIWGDRYAKPWGGFPATKWDNVPLSHKTHASLNHTAVHEVPWTLESTPLPASGSLAGKAAVPQPVTLDGVARWAAQQGFTGQYKLSVPTDEAGVFTIAYDARNQDSALPSGDRFVHIDQYTGHALADVRFADYPFLGKVLAWGIALHKGMAGWVNFAFNLVYLALTLLLCVSGILMWWKRRPVGSLGAPQLPKNFRLTTGVALGAIGLGLMFPLGGAAIVVFAVIDYLAHRGDGPVSAQPT